jgi:CubicO group peptidase (beta-lactamase class C family)
MHLFSTLLLLTGCSDGNYGNQTNGPSRHEDTGDQQGEIHCDSADTGAPSDDCDGDELYPADSWRTAMPEDHGFDPSLLQEAADFAGDNASNCLVVVRHGEIVGEWYWQDTTPTTLVKNWSVAKSYTSAVVGVAVDRGDIPSVNSSASEWIPEWRNGTHDGISVGDLLSMSSGLRLDMIADNVTMPLANDMTALAIAAPVDNPPGALWEYNNHSVQALEPVIRGATGMAADDYATQHLFDPMGMTVDWKRDEHGQPAMYMNAKASCRDNARFGYLYLHRGCWDGERLLSEQWIDDSIGSSTSMNRGYGYYWWLSGESPTLDSVTLEDKPYGLHHFGPDDSYCAAGLGSQMIEVIPSLDMVVVRMGTAPHDDLANWLDPAALLDNLTHDGEQIVHNGVLERVLDALVVP